jgi:hypothetical protein
MLDTLGAMIKDDRFGSGHTRTKMLAAIDKILAAGRAAGDVGTQPTSEDVAAGLIGMFSVAPTAGNSEQSARLLDIFMSGLSVPNRGEWMTQPDSTLRIGRNTAESNTAGYQYFAVTAAASPWGGRRVEWRTISASANDGPKRRRREKRHYARQKAGIRQRRRGQLTQIPSNVSKCVSDGHANGPRSDLRGRSYW